MQFLVLAYDGTDDGALDRRMAARADHLANAKVLFAEGTVITAAAMTDEDGKMIGAVVQYAVDDIETLEAIVQSDPYVAGDVWREVTIVPIKLAPLAE